MEGILLVPPERGTIIGRAVWKVSLFPPVTYTFPSVLLTLVVASICGCGKWSKGAARQSELCADFGSEPYASCQPCVER
jgi:hypothetical protein